MPETTAEDIVKLYSSNRTNASLAVTSGIDANPQQAARAMELSRSSGVDGSIIYDDMDEFERNYKAQMAGAIVRNNPQLTEFVRSNPMVPKLINNDYATLDGISQKLDLLGLPMKAINAPSAITKLMLPDDHDPLERFKEGGPLGNWLLQDPTARNDYRLLSSIVTGLPPVAALELFFRGIGGLQNTAADMSYNLGASEAVQSIPSPRIPGLEQYMPNFGNAGLLKSLASGIQFAGMMGRPHDHLGPAIAEHNTRLARETDNASVALWLANDRKPPQGVLPEYDEYLLGRNTKDVESLGEIIGDTQKADLRQHDADLLASYVRQHTDSNIGISAEGIAALYGDKVPMPDDGLLGWIPNLAEQLEAAKRSGDDIHVPLADFAAKVEPEVFKALADDLRVRPEGITKREGEVDKERSAAIPPPIPLPEAVPATRAAYGLEPLLSVGDRNIRMEKRPTEMKADVFGADQWRLLDEQGNKVGHLEITPHDNRLYVDMVQGMNGLGPRDFGPALMRSLLRQIKEQYPEAQEIGGFKVAGARGLAGAEKEVWIKLDRLENVDYNRFQEVLEGGQWETYSPNIKGYIKPDFLRSEEDRQLVNIVNEEAARILGKKVGVQVVDTAKVEGTIAGQRAGEPIQIGGAYIRYRDAYPLILIALDGENSLGTLRHEAVHHLRGYGFFKPGEWDTLEAQALAGGWLTKYGIDRRYPEANPSLKLEEAIAEAYRDWAGGAKAPTPEIHGLFERMKAFFAAIKERISQLLGKDATWEDVFQKVDTGEVGAREGTKPLDPRAFDEKLNVEQLRKAANDNYLTEEERRLVEDHVHNLQDEDMARQSSERVRAAQTDVDRQKIQDVINKILAHDNALDEKLSVEPPAEPSRIFERANALGMTIERFKAYDKNMQEQHIADEAATTKRVLQAQTRVQTKQWKEDRTTLRAQIANDINLRPDIAADNYFADGVLYGEKVDRIKLGTDYLTEQQRASLPRDYYNKAGASPDDLAGLFGFPDGATLVGHLSGLSEIRRQSGMRPIEFKRRVIDIETDRQMHQKYGVLDENIMDSVKEQVASETSINRVHEETLYYAEKAGVEAPLTKDAVRQMVSDEFEQSSVTSANSDRYLTKVRRKDNAIQDALLKKDAEAAFREAQSKSYALMLAKEAVGFEHETVKFEKLVGRLVKREVKGIDPAALDFIHGLLLEAGVPIKRTPEEVATSKQYYGKESGEATLPKYVEARNRDGYDPAVSETIQDGQVKQLDQMTVAEMREFMDAITSLNHIGRKVRSIEIAGEKKDWQDFRAEVIANIQSLPLRSDWSLGKGGKGGYIYGFDAQLTRMEELVKDLDLRKELGPIYNAVIVPMMHSKAYDFDLKTDLSKHFQEVRGSFDGKWRKSLNDTIDQDIIVDPRTGPVGERAAYDMTRENLIQIMLNWGTRSNIGKVVQGFAMAKFGRRLTREEFPIYEAQIKGLIDKHATIQDWQFVEQMWKPFKSWREKMEDVSRSTSGVVPKMIDVSPVVTGIDLPDGTKHTIEGGYWPVHYDRLRSDIATIEDRKPTQDGVFGNNYFRAATAKGHLKERTGYVDFVDISTSLEQAAGTMQQTMHDIAFRDALIQAGRVFYDSGIRSAIRNHYGPEYEAQLVPWLRRIANQYTEDPSVKPMNDALRRARINLIGHALPLNLKVILSPDIGVPDPAAWASHLANRSENIKFAMEKSDEIRHLVYNMDRDFRESLDRITLDPTVSDFQKKAIQFGFVPIAKVSQEFRVSTFVDQYNKALSRGKTEAEAAIIADSFVRERHGAASVVDLPAIMQSSEGMKMYTTFYGFFNTMYNWQRQLPGNVRRGEWNKFMENALGSVVVGAAFGATLFNQRKEDDSWFKIIGKALLLQPLSTIPLVREASSYAMEGYLPRSPLASLLGSVGSIYTDAKHLYKGERLEKPITHVANVIGLTTGLPMAQVGRTSQFTSDVIRGRQKPKNIADWARGIITGEAKLKK